MDLKASAGCSQRRLNTGVAAVAADVDPTGVEQPDRPCWGGDIPVATGPDQAATVTGEDRVTSSQTICIGGGLGRCNGGKAIALQVDLRTITVVEHFSSADQICAFTGPRSHLPAALVPNHKRIRVGHSRDHASRQRGGVLNNIDISPRHAATIDGVITTAASEGVVAVEAD